MAIGKTGSWEALPRALTDLIGHQFGVSLLPPLEAGDHPALAWRRCGLMDVTGRSDGPGRVPPVPLTLLADAALDALRQLSGATLPSSGSLLLGERARLMGLAPQGEISANGSCRLIEAGDGLVALNLPRGDDWDLVTAMVQQPVADWNSLSVAAQAWPRDDLVARARLLGLAAAVDRLPDQPSQLFQVEHLGKAASAPTALPLVVDLSALWAGPLAGSLLGMAGARVVKVESSTRPDGARGGHPGFFKLLNNGKQSLLLDFRDAADIDRLRALVREADIVIEGSRPRALRDLGLDARAEAARGATWLSITAYGRGGDAADWIGFGDDAAVAGGLTSAMRVACGETLFVGDAIADPLTGTLAAAAGWASWLGGGGRIVSLALADTVAFAGTFAVKGEEAARWQAMAEADRSPLYALRNP